MKVKIEGKLPKGFKYVNGSIVRTMEQGGSVNHTLGPINRNDANLEAEKGETALTDLTNDGAFELYNIGGKRHSEGGTPLNLPEQSFVFSDTAKMKFTIAELAELGITSKKKMTPAAVSKKFPLNQYTEILENPESDKISIATAEDMINKNKLKLSQIAFMQERKKNFADGLPLASYPYLIENGIDPRELEAKIEEQNNPQLTQEQMAMGPQMQQLQQFTGNQPMKKGGGTDNPGFKALPKEVQENILRNMKKGGGTDNPGFRALPDYVQAKILKNAGMGYEMDPNMIPQTGVPQGYQRPENPLGLPGYQIKGEYNPFATKFVKPTTDAESYYGQTKKHALKNKMGSAPTEKASSIGYRPRTFLGNLGARIGNIFRSDEMDVDPTMTYYDPATGKNIAELNYGTLNKDMSPLPGSGIPDCPNATEKQKECDKLGKTFDPYTCDCADLPKKTIRDEYYKIGGREVSKEEYDRYTDGGTKIYMRDGKLIPWQEAEKEEQKYGGTISPFKLDKLKQFTQGGQNNMMQNFMQPEMTPMSSNQGMLSDTQKALQNITMYRQKLMEEYETAKAYIVENPNALEDPEKAVELQRSIITMEQQLQELDVQTKTIERQLMQESTQLDPFSSALGQEPQQANPMMAKYGTELPKAMFGLGRKEAKEMIKDDPMSFARLMSGDVTAAANFARYGGALPVFRTQGELTGSDAWGYQGDDADGNPIIGEREPVFATYDPNRQQGADAHSNAFNVMASKDFDPVRQLWIDKYRETAAQNPTGSKRWLLNKPDGTAYSDAELFMIFNKMNQYLSTVASGEGGDIGSVFKADASGNTDALAKKYGYGEKAPTEEEIRIFQGMYQSLNNAKIEDQTGLLDQIVTTPLGQAQVYTKNDIAKMKQNGVWTDEKEGDPKMVDANGNNVSFVDGKLGHTTGGQFYRAENKVNIDEKKEDVKVECDEETRLAKTKECVEQGKRFDLSICDCAEIPGDFKEPKYPPYETFPQDDLLVASKSAQLAGLQQINPVRQPVLDPVLANPMYVDPRQALSTMEATAAAAIRANPDQATAIMGKMQDASEKIINEHHAMNTKIYNNAQNVNVPLINDAAERKSEAFKNYMDEANAAQENFMVSQMELTDNLVDAVNTQMSNADEMYIRNLENPNFFYSPQAHNVEYYNQRELDGKVINQNPIDAELAEYQRIKAMDPEFADLYYKNKYSAKNMENRNNSSVDVTRPSEEENAKLGIETKRNVIRQKDLLRSKRELRKWIMGL